MASDQRTFFVKINMDFEDPSTQAKRIYESLIADGFDVIQVDIRDDNNEPIVSENGTHQSF